MPDEEDRAEIAYGRLGDLVYLRLRNISTAEIRQVMVGLWKRLDDDEQQDFIHELEHYRDPDSTLSKLAHAVAYGDLHEQSSHPERREREEREDG